MHVPLPFRESDPAYIKGFLQSHGFATLVSSHQGRPMASHLLLETQGSDDSQLVLSGHMSRENPQWRTFDPVNEVLAIFQGPHSYVSAARYSVPSALSSGTYSAVEHRFRAAGSNDIRRR